jgi:[ribosomal protein S18]-alanine N-acetyltransferase
MAVAERTRVDRSRSRSVGWARVSAWRGHADIAQLVPVDGRTPSRAELDRGLERLKKAGQVMVVTSALTTSDSLPYIDAGFVVKERLHLLEHVFGSATSIVEHRSEPPLRRASRSDRPAVLSLDGLAFDESWSLSREDLSDALRATPSVRFRVGEAPGQGLTAYAITGRAGRRGYLQRLAVHPHARRRGWGRVLVADALRWLSRHDVNRALVNTQWQNDAALTLYESCGFRRLPVGLCVLQRSL